MRRGQEYCHNYCSGYRASNAGRPSIAGAVSEASSEIYTVHVSASPKYNIYMMHSQTVSTRASQNHDRSHKIQRTVIIGANQLRTDQWVKPSPTDRSCSGRFVFYIFRTTSQNCRANCSIIESKLSRETTIHANALCLPRKTYTHARRQYYSTRFRFH